MTIEQALQIINNVCAQFKGTLDEHKQIQMAIAKVKSDLEPKDKEQKENEG